MRIALLGPGGIATKHAAAARALGHEIVAAIGRHAGRTAAFTAEHGGEPFTDLDRAIDATAPQLLIDAAPPFSRRGETEHAAGRGIHLLVEKPVALTIEAAQRMVAAAGTAGVVAANGFMYRFGDAIAAWRAADTGAVGLYAGSYHCNALHTPWWRDRERSGGQLVEQLIHQIDLIRHLMGEPDIVYARRANLFHRSVKGYTAEDIGAVTLGWNDGRLATLNASNIATPGLWVKAWQVYAERLTGSFASWNDAVFTATREGAAPQPVTGTTDVFQAQLADVVAAIEARRPPAVTLADGAASLALALAAARSADEGREVRLT